MNGCAASLPTCPGARTTPDAVYLISHGWHTDLALPATGPLARFRSIFPGLVYLVIGFGRRTFLVAPVHTFADLLIGPLPGDGALEVLALNAPPDIAYGEGTLALLLPTAEQRARLDDAIWSSLQINSDGTPRAIAPGPITGSVFYASTFGYSGLYTCNSWTADMLNRAGLPVSPSLDVFAVQTMRRAAPLAQGGLCRISRPAASWRAPPGRSAG